MMHLPNPLVLLTAGSVFLLSGVIFGWILFPNYIHYKISDQIKLTRGSEIWEKWEDIPIPIYFKLYLFNVTNPDEVIKGEDPNLREVGPYIYLEHRKKIDIRETENGTIIYKEQITYFFQQEKSNGLTEDDVLTILNIPYVAMSLKAAELPYPLSHIAQVFIGKFKEKPFISKTVRQLLFEGWHLPILEEIHEYLGQELMPNNTFGLFVGKNGTDDGDLEIDAGLKDSQDFGKVLSWRGKRQLDWWKNGTKCNEISGTDGSIFPPFVTKSRRIDIFNADLCRSLFLTFEEEVEFLGIPAYRFTAPPEMLEDPRKGGGNRCFCSEDDVDIDKCLKAGTIDLGPCREGAPVAMSTPHFLDAFQGYAEKSGLVADKAKHETVMDIEPFSGLVLRASKRIQINVQLKPVPDVRSLSRMTEMIFPIIWADESAQIDEQIAQELRSKLLTPLKIVEITKWSIVGISSCLICISLCILLGAAFFKSQGSNFIKEDSDSSKSMLKEEKVPEKL